MTLKERARALKAAVMTVLDSSLKEGTTTSKDQVKAAVGTAMDELMPDKEEPEKKEPEKTAPAKEADAETDPAIAELAKRVEALEQALAKLLEIEAAETDAAKTGDAALCTDQDIIARAEILAPGIAKTADVKVKALDAAMKAEDGKAAITMLLGGKPFATADKDLLFVAASELLKGTRREQLAAAGKVTLDMLPALKAGTMTAEQINEKNAAHYAKR